MMELVLARQFLLLKNRYLQRCAGNFSCNVSNLFCESWELKCSDKKKRYEKFRKQNSSEIQKLAIRLAMMSAPALGTLAETVRQTIQRKVKSPNKFFVFSMVATFDNYFEYRLKMYINELD